MDSFKEQKLLDILQDISNSLKIIANKSEEKQTTSIDKKKISLQEVLNDVSVDMEKAKDNLKRQDEKFKPLVDTLQQTFLGYLFSVTPQVYDTNDFTPKRELMIKKDDVVVNSKIKVEHLEYPDDLTTTDEYDEKVAKIIIEINNYLIKNNF